MNTPFSKYLLLAILSAVLYPILDMVSGSIRQVLLAGPELARKLDQAIPVEVIGTKYLLLIFFILTMVLAWGVLTRRVPGGHL